jgi:hypothetical protein
MQSAECGVWRAKTPGDYSDCTAFKTAANSRSLIGGVDGSRQRAPFLSVQK